MADYNYLLTDLQAPGRELHAVNGHIVRREIIWYAWGRIHGKFGYLEERDIAPLLVSESLARDNLHDGETYIDVMRKSLEGGCSRWATFRR